MKKLYALMPIGSRLSNSCTFISKNKRFLFVVLSLALLEISFLRDFIYLEKTGLDPSWMWAMNNIFAFVPGKDWAFTYGPLGFMFVPQMVGNNVFWANLLNNFLPVSLLIGGVGYLIFRQYRLEGKSALFRASVLLGFWLLFFPLPYHWELVSFVLSVCLLSLTGKIKIFRVLSVVSGALLAFTLLLKFNVFVCNTLIYSFLVLIFLFKGRRLFWNFAFSAGTAFLVGLVLAIVFIFKNPANFAEWLVACLDISSYFSQVMIWSVRGYPLLYIALLLLVLYLLLLGICFFRNKECFNLLFIGLPLAFFSFKCGFVRADSAHLITFFTLFFYLCSLILFLTYKRDKNNVFVWQLAVFYIVFGACVQLFSTLQANFERALSVERQLDILENYAEVKRRQYAKRKLPQSWLDLIGKQTVEALPYELSYIPANELNWKINPIIQLYSAYSKRLDEKSAASFSEDTRADFIITEFSAIDGRNMILDTPATWSAIQQNYKVSQKDDRKILLQKRTNAEKAKFVPVKCKNISLNQKIRVSDLKGKGGLLYASLAVRPTLWGRVRTFLFKAAPVLMVVRRSDKTVKIYKLAPDTLQNPFPISLIPDNISEFHDLLTGQDKGLITEFLIFADEDNWQKKIQMKLYKREFEND